MGPEHSQVPHGTVTFILYLKATTVPFLGYTGLAVSTKRPKNTEVQTDGISLVFRVTVKREVGDQGRAVTPPLGSPGHRSISWREALVHVAAAAALVLCLLYSLWKGAEGGTPRGHSEINHTATPCCEGRWEMQSSAGAPEPASPAGGSKAEKGHWAHSHIYSQRTARVSGPQHWLHIWVSWRTWNKCWCPGHAPGQLTQNIGVLEPGVSTFKVISKREFLRPGGNRETSFPREHKEVSGMLAQTTGSGGASHLEYSANKECCDIYGFPSPNTALLEPLTSVWVSVSGAVCPRPQHRTPHRQITCWWPNVTDKPCTHFWKR